MESPSGMVVSKWSESYNKFTLQEICGDCRIKEKDFTPDPGNLFAKNISLRDAILLDDV
jgi:hypothetical protein